MKVQKENYCYHYTCVWHVSKITLLVALQTFNKISILYQKTIAKVKLIYIKIRISVAVHQVNNRAD